MANLSASQILEDGARNTVLKFLGVLDTSDLASTVVVNLASQYKDPIGDTLGCYRVDKIEYVVDDGITVNLFWGGGPTQFANVAGRGKIDIGLRYGGISDDESVTIRDGRILATTTGYVAASVVSFELTLWLVKQSFISQAAAAFLLMETGDFLLLESGGKIQLE